MKMKLAVGQGGGPTPVINDTLAGIVYEAQLKGDQVIGLMNGLEGGGLNPQVDGNLVDLSKAEPFHIRGIPGSYLGTTRMKLKPRAGDKPNDEAKIQIIRQNMDNLGIDATIYIGGNDSAEVIRSLGKGIHGAKTEDNDLRAQDHEPGWGSATLGNSEMIRRLTADMSGFNPRVGFKDGIYTYSVAPVVVYQTQGRNAGWLALGTAFAKVNHAGDVVPNAAPHLFLTCERPYKEDVLVGCVDDLLRKQGYAFIVVNEELVDENRVPLEKTYCQGGERLDDFGNAEHSRSGSFNYADFIAATIQRRLKVGTDSYKKVKETPITPHHIQRSLARSNVDAMEAFEVGREVVRALHRGEMNVSIGLLRVGEGYNITPGVIPLDEVAARVRQVDSRYLGDIHGPTEAFYRDFMPLIGGPLAMTHFVGPRLEPYKG